LSGVENFASERGNLVFISFRNFKPVKRRAHILNRNRRCSDVSTHVISHFPKEGDEKAVSAFPGLGLIEKCGESHPKVGYVCQFQFMLELLTRSRDREKGSRAGSE